MKPSGEGQPLRDYMETGRWERRRRMIGPWGCGSGRGSSL